MRFFDRFRTKSIFKDKFQNLFVPRNAPSVLEWSNSVVVTPYGMARETAATWPSIHRAVSLIAGAGSNLICDAINVIDADRKVVKTPEAMRALSLFKETPCGDIPSSQFVEDALADLALAGNAIIYNDRSRVTGRNRLILCYPGNTEIEERDGMLEFRVRPDNLYEGQEITASSMNIIIARGPRINGRYQQHPKYRYLARPVVQTLARAVITAVNSEDYVSKFFDTKRGGSIKSDFSISFDHAMDEAEQERFAKYLDEYLAERAPLVLPSGGKVSPLSPNPQSSNLLELREFQVSEACRIFGVPGVLLAHDGGGNTFGSSISQLNRLFLDHSLKHYISRFLFPLSAKLLPPGQSFAVDYSRAYTGDLEAVSGIVANLRPTSGAPDAILSREEVRSLIGFEKPYDSDWMDPSVYMKNAGKSDDGEAGI